MQLERRLPGAGRQHERISAERPDNRRIPENDRAQLQCCDC
jgi:hypothetical protein